MSDAVDTVALAPDDGWRYHPKHVERFTGINKLYTVASCWTIIVIYTKHLFKYTNQMHNVYSLHIFIVFLLRVSAL